MENFWMHYYYYTNYCCHTRWSSFLISSLSYSSLTQKKNDDDKWGDNIYIYLKGKKKINFVYIN